MTRFLRLVALAALCITGLVVAGCGADESSEAANVDPNKAVKAPPEVTAELKKLEALARDEEGAIQYYFILGEEANRDLFNAFKKRYPFIEFEVSGGDPFQLLEKVLSENKTGNVVADIIQGGPLEDRVLNTDNNYGMEFDPAGEAQANEAFQLDSNVIVSDYFTFHTVYNTNVVKEADAPTSLEDLTKPEWRGKFGIDLEQIDWFAGELGHYGQEEGMDLMRRLGENEPVLFSGAEGYEQVAAGSLPVAVNLFSAAVVPYFEKEAPIAFAKMDHIVAQPDVYIGLKDTQVPNKVKLFFAYLFTEEAQEILSQNSFKNPTLEGVPQPPNLEGICDNPCELFVETSEVFGGFDERVAQFRSVFTE